MDFLSGISYNFRGLVFGLRTPKLLLLGLVRFFILFLLTLFLGISILAHRQELVGMIWAMPDGGWLLWLWYPVSGLICLMLFGVAALLGYLVAQILFSVIIMDAMSRITERMFTGKVIEPPAQSWGKRFWMLIKQEFPRAIAPVVMLMGLMVMSWMTPLGPIVSLLSSGLVVIFLAWDHTDLPAARRMVPFKQRLAFLTKTIPFHLGFGLPFLIPVLNALLLSFAPVGATLYQIARDSDQK